MGSSSSACWLRTSLIDPALATRRTSSDGPARGMRASLTPSEQLLWARIRGRRLGVAFRRRVPLLGRFIADFFAPAERLVIEVDGEHHAEQARADARRDAVPRSRWLPRASARCDARRERCRGGHRARPSGAEPLSTTGSAIVHGAGRCRRKRHLEIELGSVDRRGARGGARRRNDLRGRQRARREPVGARCEWKGALAVAPGALARPSTICRCRTTLRRS